MTKPLGLEELLRTLAEADLDSPEVSYDRDLGHFSLDWWDGTCYAVSAAIDGDGLAWARLDEDGPSVSGTDVAGLVNAVRSIERPIGVLPHEEPGWVFLPHNPEGTGTITLEWDPDGAWKIVPPRETFTLEQVAAMLEAEQKTLAFTGDNPPYTERLRRNKYARMFHIVAGWLRARSRAEGDS